MKPVRFVMATAAAFLVTVTLFWVMQRLVRSGPDVPPVPAATVVLDRIKAAEEPPPPPPPPTATAAAPERVLPRPQGASLPLEAIEFPSLAAQLPRLDLKVAVAGRLQSPGVPTGVAGGDALAAFAGGEQGFEGDDLVPISSARPRYPRSAAEREIEGWVEVIFVVTGEGRVNNVRVLDASPRGVFEDAAVSAMSRWLYAPYYVGGKPVAREATQLFEFRLADVQELYLWDD